MRFLSKRYDFLYERTQRFSLSWRGADPSVLD